MEQSTKDAATKDVPNKHRMGESAVGMGQRAITKHAVMKDALTKHRLEESAVGMEHIVLVDVLFSLKSEG